VVCAASNVVKFLCALKGRGLWGMIQGWAMKREKK